MNSSTSNLCNELIYYKIVKGNLKEYCDIRNLLPSETPTRGELFDLLVILDMDRNAEQTQKIELKK